MKTLATPVLSGLFFLCLAVGVYTDVRARRVSNALVVAILLIGFVGALLGISPAGSIVQGMAGMGIGLAMWLPFWLLGLLGAGDVKYFAAASFWVGAALAWRAALLAALVGGALGVLVLVKRGGVRSAFSNVAMQAQQAELLIASADVSASEARQRTFPYALPMAIGIGVAALWSSQLLGI